MSCTDAIAFEAAAALDGYGEQLTAVRGGLANPHGIATMQHELRRVCNCCLRLPGLSAPSIALLLAHHRLLAELAQAAPARGPALPDAARESFRAVEQSLGLLQRCCRELLLAPRLQ